MAPAGPDCRLRASVAEASAWIPARGRAGVGTGLGRTFVVGVRADLDDLHFGVIAPYAADRVTSSVCMFWVDRLMARQLAVGTGTRKVWFMRWAT